MAGTENFTCFTMLRPELRIQIWTEALTVPSVWVAVLNKTGGGLEGTSEATRASITLQCVGYSPHLAGLSCSEARGVMIQVYQQPLRESSIHGVYLIKLDTCVLVFASLVRSPANNWMLRAQHIHVSQSCTLLAGLGVVQSKLCTAGEALP